MSPVYIKTRTVKTGKRYVVYWRRGGRSFPELYAGSFKTMKDARARRDPAILLARLKNGHAAQPSITVRWAEFIASRVDVGDAARAQYRNSRDRWIPILGADRDPATITPLDVMGGIAELAEDLAPSTITQYVGNLGMVLDFADVDPNPVRSPKVKLLRTGLVQPVAHKTRIDVSQSGVSHHFHGVFRLTWHG